MEEHKYPIYYTGATWSQNNIDYKNGKDFYIMYREDPGVEAVRQEAIEWIDSLFEQKKDEDIKCDLIKLICRFIEMETWCCRWFNHYTYNTHLSDADLELSFELFVDRKKIKYGNVDALMGAHERGRWSSPCRCEDCQKAGVVYIDH